MLGQERPRTPITGDAAREIRATLWRKQTGNLTDEDKERENFIAQTMEHPTVKVVL